MKKKLFSFHDEVAAALDSQPNQSAFVEAVTAKALGIELPETAVERRAITDQLDDSVELEEVKAESEVVPAAEPAPETPAYQPVIAEATPLDDVVQPIQSEPSEPEADGPPEPEIPKGLEEVVKDEAQSIPVKVETSAPAFEEVNAPAAGFEEVPSTPADRGAVDEGQEPAQPVETKPETEEYPTYEAGSKVCPTCGSKFTTPYCLNCL